MNSSRACDARRENKRGGQRYQSAVDKQQSQYGHRGCGRQWHSWILSMGKYAWQVTHMAPNWRTKDYHTYHCWLVTEWSSDRTTDGSTGQWHIWPITDQVSCRRLALMPRALAPEHRRECSFAFRDLREDSCNLSVFGSQSSACPVPCVGGIAWGQPSGLCEGIAFCSFVLVPLSLPNLVDYLCNSPVEQVVIEMWKWRFYCYNHTLWSSWYLLWALFVACKCRWQKRQRWHELRQTK